MKKVLTFAAIALLFAACSNVEKFQPMVQELSAKWDSTTAGVTEFATTVKNEQANMMNAANSMQIAPETMEKWGDDTKAKYTELQNSVAASSNNLAAISSEVDAYVTTWTEKSQELKALQDGIAAGKVEGDVSAKIAELTAAANDAEAKLNDWKTKFEEVKTSAAQNQQMVAEFMTANAPAAPATTGKQ